MARAQKRRIGAALGVGLVAALPVAAQEAYPSRPIEMIVTYGPGGGSDAMGREFARLAEQRLEVAMPVLNVAGASGALGTQQLADSEPDGYTVGQSTALTVTAWAAGIGEPQIGKLDYIALLQNTPSMLFVTKASPLQTFDAFAEKVKAEPGSIDVATSGAGTPDEITLLYLASVGMPTVPVSFSQPGDRYAQVVGGHVDMLYDEPGDVVGFLQSGDLKPIIVFDDERHPAFPDVPTAKEKGLELTDLPNFRAIAVPKGLPEDRRQKLVEVADEIARSEEWRNFCARSYTCTDPLPPEQLEALVTATYNKAKVYLERFGAK